ncbi:purine permease, partial [Lactobacillus sp. XV13L]|nr:purine permease [Lactobacillus sp. XV13L]
MKTTNNDLIYGPEDNLPLLESGLLGLQHVLAMDVYVPPLIIAGLLSMGTVQKTGFLQVAFLACGIGTLIQTGLLMKMPMSQGPSYVPVGAVVGVYLANDGAHGGMATVIGACVVGALLLVVLGVSGIYQKIVNKLVPPIVGGTIIACVGLSLLPSALNDNIFQASGNVNQNMILAGITMFALLLVIILSNYFARLQKFLKASSIVIAMFVGTLTAASMHLFSWKSIQNAAWFSWPHFTILHYGINFSASAILTFVIIYIVLTTETMGTWFAMSSVTTSKITKKQWDRGLIGEGLSCLIAALLGSTPMTGYSTNAGVVSITGVASRKVFLAVGFWFIILGFVGKLSAFLAAIPSAVIGGIFSIICIIIMLNGLKSIPKADGNQIYIIGIP